ncbi:hypothetical protein ORL36_05735 [Klebsiella pasteurii]|uniref:hypothetical protein n=1 Tax=Klebsiella TaxID=570 RepID=UPI0022456723|nr:hypothetical protein [Klebsiella pasteurii]MCW9584128.1 hypothetical protein [Klebsiella pasteurii]
MKRTIIALVAAVAVAVGTSYFATHNRYAVDGAKPAAQQQYAHPEQQPGQGYTGGLGNTLLRWFKMS